MKTLGQIAHESCLAQVKCIDRRALLRQAPLFLLALYPIGWDELEPEAKQCWETIAKAIAEEAIKDFISRMPRLVPQYRESETPPSEHFTPTDIFVLAGFCIGLAQRDVINLNDYERSTLRRAGEALRLTALSLKLIKPLGQIARESTQSDERT